MTPDEALDTQEENAVPFPQVYTLRELSKCTTISKLNEHARTLRMSIFRYPYKPLAVRTPRGKTIYTMPGDYLHDRFRAPKGLKWVNRGVMTIDHGRHIRLEFTRSLEIDGAAYASYNRGSDWCDVVVPSKL